MRRRRCINTLADPEQGSAMHAAVAQFPRDCCRCGSHDACGGSAEAGCLGKHRVAKGKRKYAFGLEQEKLDSHFFTPVARHNYATANTMKHFRAALLKSQTKRIELIEVYTWLKLDRHLNGGQFRAGWGCPGISKLPRGVAESDRKILGTREGGVPDVKRTHAEKLKCVAGMSPRSRRFHRYQV